MIGDNADGLKFGFVNPNFIADALSGIAGKKLNSFVFISWY
jgi:hypothetical protein